MAKRTHVMMSYQLLGDFDVRSIILVSAVITNTQPVRDICHVENRILDQFSLNYRQIYFSGIRHTILSCHVMVYNFCN